MDKNKKFGLPEKKYYICGLVRVFLCTMDNKSLLKKVEAATGIGAEECAALQKELTCLIETALASGSAVSIPTFGNFEPRKRNERIMNNPSVHGKRLLLPPKVIVSFKPSTIIKNKINGQEK